MWKQIKTRSDINDRGDEIYNKMVSLARQKQYPKAIDAPTPGLLVAQLV